MRNVMNAANTTFVILATIALIFASCNRKSVPRRDEALMRAEIDWRFQLADGYKISEAEVFDDRVEQRFFKIDWPKQMTPELARFLRARDFRGKDTVIGELNTNIMRFVITANNATPITWAVKSELPQISKPLSWWTNASRGNCLHGFIESEDLHGHIRFDFVEGPTSVTAYIESLGGKR